MAKIQKPGRDRLEKGRGMRQERAGRANGMPDRERGGPGKIARLARFYEERTGT